MKTYRDFVKSLPCAVCGTTEGVEQHHGIQLPGTIKGMALKNPEILSFPLCAMHHRNLHANVEEFELWYGTQAEHIVRTQAKAHHEGVGRWRST